LRDILIGGTSTKTTPSDENINEIQNLVKNIDDQEKSTTGIKYIKNI